MKKPISVPAPEYIRLMFEWILLQLEDEKVFPTDGNSSSSASSSLMNHLGNFPKDFENTIKTIFRKMFRFYGHIYCQHAKQVNELKLSAHLQTAFKHFYLFIKEFNLVDPSQMTPLQHEIDEILKEEKQVKQNSLEGNKTS